jgi:hypothetical protein
VTEQEKDLRQRNHKRGMQLLAAFTIEHGLRLLPSDDKAAVLIREDVAIVRRANEWEIKSRYAEAKRRKVSYTPAGLLLQGSTAMLFLAKHQGHIPDGPIQSVLYFPDEAAYLVDCKKGEKSREREAERNWQATKIRPLLGRLFSKRPANLLWVRHLRTDPPRHVSCSNTQAIDAVQTTPKEAPLLELG